MAWEASEVCAIIKACGESGVRVFRGAGLYLALGPAPVKTYPLLAAETPRPPSGPDHARQNAETLERDEQAVKEEQLRMLMIENPLEYERQMRDGELTDEPNGEDDGEA